MSADPRDTTTPTAPTRMLALWCPDWPVVAWHRAAPAGQDPTGTPVAVLESGRRGLVVRAASVEARAEGVTRGLRRREAEARCPGLVVVDADLRAEAVAFEDVARALEDVTPRLEIERPGRLVFPLRGPARYFGGDEAVVERVLAVTAEVGVPGARVGVADGSFAAGLAARRAATGGPVVVPAGGTPAFLAGLPIGAVIAAADDDSDEHDDLVELAALARRLGLRTLGDFAALPEPAVLARFATVGVRAHRRARGLEADEVVLSTPPPELVRTCELDPPAERLDMVAFTAKTMADELLEDLGRRGLAAGRILVEAETEHGETLSRRWRHEGALTALALATRVHWQLESWLTGGGSDPAQRPSAGLVLLRLVPDGIVPATGRQLGFWGGDAAADETARRTLVRVQGMLGVDAVVRPVRAGGRTPAERVRWVPWGEKDPPSSERGLSGPSPEATGAGDLSERREAGIPSSSERGLSGPSPEATGAGDLSERREAGIPSSSERGLSGPSPEATGAGDMAPWPGHVPGPAPVVVHDDPVPARLLDADGRPVTVSGRGEVSGTPTRLESAGLSGTVRAVAGPWPHDVRWWDRVTRVRRVLWQLVVADESDGHQACLVEVRGATATVTARYA